MPTLTLIGGLIRHSGAALVLSPKPGTSDPCCCKEECWETTVTFPNQSLPFRSCNPQVMATQNVTIPDDVCIPACAQVSWSADDDIAINDVRLNGTWDLRSTGCPYGDACCASAGSRRICIDTRELKIDLIDTVGVNAGGTCTIKICPSDCGCIYNDSTDCLPEDSSPGPTGPTGGSGSGG
jgi:hypothetical protein